MKNRFQSLPFKFNLQRYSVGHVQAGAGARQDRGGARGRGDRAGVAGRGHAVHGGLRRVRADVERRRVRTHARLFATPRENAREIVCRA